MRAAGLGHQRSVVLEVVRGAPAIEYSREVGQEIAELEAEAGRLEAELVVVRRRLLALRRFDSQ